MAINLEDFAEKLVQIDVASIDFHCPKGDFQTGVRDVIKDNELADRLCYIQIGFRGKAEKRCLQNHRKELKTRSIDFFDRR